MRNYLIAAVMISFFMTSSAMADIVSKIKADMITSHQTGDNIVEIKGKKDIDSHYVSAGIGIINVEARNIGDDHFNSEIFLKQLQTTQIGGNRAYATDISRSTHSYTKAHAGHGLINVFYYQ